MLFTIDLDEVNCRTVQLDGHKDRTFMDEFITCISAPGDREIYAM